MNLRYLEFICTKEHFLGCADSLVVEFNAYDNYEMIVDFFDSCPECQSFPKDEYFSGDWYENWEDYVIWENERIAARAGIWKVNHDQWEVAGVITHPEYRQKGYAARIVAHCIAKILECGKTAVLSTAENNHPMIAAARKAGFVMVE